jgi:hypothetical protein
MYEACTKNYEEYSKKILKLNSIHVTALVLMYEAENALKPFLNKVNEVDMNVNTETLNISKLVSKTTEPKINKIPSCLSAILTGKDIRKSNNHDIFDPKNEQLDVVDELTSEADEKLKESLDKFKNDPAAVEKSIEVYVKYLVKLLFSYEYLELFGYLDILQNFLNKTKFVEVYNDWKDSYYCLYGNCPELRDSMPDDYFLWSDDSKRHFILPIDLNTGKIRISKFDDNMNKNQKIEAKKIELYYYKYLESKDKIIKKASDICKEKGIPDDKNPFKDIKIIKNDLTFNNLF